MAFVPGHKHDLFLSYAHAEGAWADAFKKALSDEFQWRAGKKLTVWQDSANLRLGQNWSSEIENAIHDAAAFLAIVSPSYLTSSWCRKEREFVLQKKLEALKVLSFYRFLKIIKTPGPENFHEEMAGTLQDIRFFSKADGYEHPEGSDEYKAMIRATVRNIRELFTLMRNRCQQLYVAPGSIEIRETREDLERELNDRGFTVKPEIPLGSEFGKGAILKAMDGVSHVIIVLGVVYDEFTAEQVEAARELGTPVVFWIQPGASQKDLKKRIQNLRKLPDGSEELNGRSIREMIPHLLEKINPRAIPEPAVPRSGLKRVYINHDATLPEDSRIAARIAEMVRSRKFEAVQSGRDGDHESLMRTSNAVLLFRAAHPDPDEWLKYNAMELALAARIYEKKPDFAAKALLVTDPSRIQAQAAGVPVYSYSEPFAPETLKPFFDRLGRPRSADGRQ